MKVVHFSTSDLGSGGYIAAYQIHKALQHEGMKSFMLVKDKKSFDDSVIEINDSTSQEPVIKRITRHSLTYFAYQKLCSIREKQRWRGLSTTFNRNTSSVSLNSIKKYLCGADIICLHWTNGFLSTKIIKSIQQFTKAPIVWTLHDVEALTGGCHYPYNCGGFKKSCGNCPQLKSNKENDMSRIIWNQKYLDLKNLDITFIAPTSWVYDRIKESSLFNKSPVERILLSVDTAVFKRFDKKIARKVLQLPKDKKIILFGAKNLKAKRKGMKYLESALSLLYKKFKTKNKKLMDSIMLVSMGDIPFFKNKYFKYKHLDWLIDRRIVALAYNSADVFACPSIEDAGPFMINEAVMCGTPIVAFNTGVAPDLITSKKRGYLAEKYNAEDFCSGLYYFLTKKGGLNTQNWKPPKECTPNFQAKKYHSLFKKVLNKKVIKNNRMLIDTALTQDFLV